MQNINDSEKLVKIASVKGIDIYNIRTDKFKTNTISVFFQDDLSKENAAKNALVPAVLRRGSVNFKTFRDIARYLEELYGAVFDCGVNKKGERQLIQFFIEFVSDKYTRKEEAVFDKAFDLLLEIITQPVLEKSLFKKEYVEQEKENIKSHIESRVNDKVQYAVARCMELMCKDEPFGIYEYGSKEDLDRIDEKELYKHYRYVLERLPMSIFITGDVSLKSIEKIIKKLSGLNRGEIKEIARTDVYKDKAEVKDVVEKMSVNQGKLTLGLRTNIAPDSQKYQTLMVYNSILGGGIHSKLFQNVREKESLAYYAFSRLEKFKGLMVISSGIEIENREKVHDIILKQMKEIEAGNISDYEFSSTLKSIETGIISIKDTQLYMVDFYLSQLITGTDDTLDSIIEKIKKVTKKDVIEISKNIRLDTVYFLTSDSRIGGE